MHRLLTLLIVFVAGACTGEALEIPLNGTSNGALDMKRDLTQPTSVVDQATGGTDTCLDIIDCTNQCASQSCVNKCLAKASSDAKAAYEALSTCIDKACPAVPASDGGTMSPCAYNPQTGQLVNENACNNCVENAQQPAGKCGSEVDACLGG